jgi:LacI family transcriptional regulator
MPSEVTLHDVARVVGVSARTVSRVVNEQGGCSSETRDRVLAAVASLGYRPNMLARGLITRRTGSIGVVGTEMADPFFTELADGVQLAARETRQTMFFASTDSDPARQHEVLHSLWSHGVDGVIIFPAAGSEVEIIEMARTGLPIVLVDSPGVRAPNLGNISSDLFEGAQQAVRHLVERGRTTIGMAANAYSVPENRPPRRESGYRSILEGSAMGYDPSLTARCPNTVVGGRQAARDLLDRHPTLDAIFAYNDLMAIGIVQELTRLGRRVPDDIAVVGFDDIAFCEALNPPLTSVRIDRDHLGREALALLSRIINEPGLAPEPIVIGVELIQRASS